MAKINSFYVVDCFTWPAVSSMSSWAGSPSIRACCLYASSMEIDRTNYLQDLQVV